MDLELILQQNKSFSKESLHLIKLLVEPNRSFCHIYTNKILENDKNDPISHIANSSQTRIYSQMYSSSCCCDMQECCCPPKNRCYKHEKIAEGKWSQVIRLPLVLNPELSLDFQGCYGHRPAAYANKKKNVFRGGPPLTSRNYDLDF